MATSRGVSKERPSVHPDVDTHENVAAHSPQKVTGAEIGRLVGVQEDGLPFVDYPSAPGRPMTAVLATPAPDALLGALVGRHVVLVFEEGDPARPLIVGFVEEPKAERIGAPRYVKIDGRHLVLEAEHELELRCGSASILLRSDGRIEIKGENLLSHARGLQRIRGAAVRIN